jgi:hypothetical protein
MGGAVSSHVGAPVTACRMKATTTMTAAVPTAIAEADIFAAAPSPRATPTETLAIRKTAGIVAGSMPAVGIEAILTAIGGTNRNGAGHRRRRACHIRDSACDVVNSVKRIAVCCAI